MALIPKVRSLPVAIISAILLVFGLWLVVPDRTAAPTSSTQSQAVEISYAGVDGQTALALLRAGHQVEAETSSFGEFVQSIDGVKADSSHFWAFYINGEMAEVGASSYVTKTGDQVTWKLETIE